MTTKQSKVGQAVDEILTNLAEAEFFGPEPSRYEPAMMPVVIELSGLAYSMLDKLTDRVSDEAGRKYTVNHVAAQLVLRELERYRL